MRPVYRARRDATIAALAKELPNARWVGEAAGLHLHVRLPEWVDELELAARAFERGARSRTSGAVFGVDADAYATLSAA